MRLFVAIDLPETVKQQVSAICTGLGDLRWVTSAQMHLTLRFIGEVTDEQAEAIKPALAKVKLKPFEMRLQGVGQFPARGQPRVIWVGIKVPNILPETAQQVDQIITGLGLPPADKPFAAHLTLARLKTAPHAEALRTFFNKHAEFETEPFTINHFVLYSSVLASEGATYHKQAIYRAQPA